MLIGGKEFKLRKGITLRESKKIRWTLTDLANGLGAWFADREDDDLGHLEKSWEEMKALLFDGVEGIPALDELGEDGIMEVLEGFTKRHSPQSK